MSDFSIQAKDLVILAIGLITGVVIQDPLIKLKDKQIAKLNLRFKQKKLSKFAAAIDSRGDLYVNGEVIHILLAPLNGFAEKNIRCSLNSQDYETTLTTQLDQIPDRLRPASTSAILNQISKFTPGPGEWDGEKVALKFAQQSRTTDGRETPIVDLEFGTSKYSAFSSVSSLWKTYFESVVSESHESIDWDQVIPGLSHSFGVNLTLRTADNKLLLTTRSAKTNSGRQLRHIAVNEGLSIEDRNSSKHPDLFACARRGVKEELGIDLAIEGSNRGAKLSIHTFALDVNRYQWAALGHVDLSNTDVTEAVIRQARAIGTAQDKFETTEFIFIPCTLDAVLEELTGNTDWIAHGWANLLHSAILIWPQEAERILKSTQKNIG
jgi:hypothetical protein